MVWGEGTPRGSAGGRMVTQANNFFIFFLAAPPLSFTKGPRIIKDGGMAERFKAPGA